MSQNNKANFSNFTLQLFFNFFNSPHHIQSIKRSQRNSLTRWLSYLNLKFFHTLYVHGTKETQNYLMLMCAFSLSSLQNLDNIFAGFKQLPVSLWLGTFTNLPSNTNRITWNDLFNIKMSEIIHISRENLKFFFEKKNQTSIYYPTIRKML